MVLKNITMMHHRIIIVKFELLSDNYSASFDSHNGQISVLQSFHSLSFVLMNHNNFICGIETGGTFFDTHGVPRTQNGQNLNRPLGLFLNLVHAWYIVSHADRLFEVMGQKSMCKHQTKWRVFSCDQAAIWLVQSVCLSVRPSVTPFSPCSHHCIIMKFSGVITMVRNVHAKGQGQRSQRSTPN